MRAVTLVVFGILVVFIVQFGAAFIPESDLALLLVTALLTLVLYPAWTAIAPKKDEQRPAPRTVAKQAMFLLVAVAGAAVVYVVLVLALQIALRSVSDDADLAVTTSAFVATLVLVEGVRKALARGDRSRLE